MVSLVTQDDDIKKSDNESFQVHTQPQKNTLPFNLVKATDISAIGTLKDVPKDGNCYFNSLWNAKCDLNQCTEPLDVTKHRQILHSFASKNWKLIVSKVLHGGDGDDTKYYFNISNTKMEIRYLNE